VQQQVKSLEKELEEKVEKQTSVKNIVDSLNQEGYIQLFQKEIQDDEARIAQFEAIQSSIQQRAEVEQNVYLNFEKSFFKELADFVIKKKIALNIRK
jgi:peptide subunit release factor RF-3